MTVTTTANRIDYVGDGIVTVFSFNFLVYTDSHLQVYLDGVLQTVDFTITLDIDNSNGFVTFDTAPAVAVAITLLREVPLTQLIDYTPYDPFPAETHERGLDLGVMRDQQVIEFNDRALRVPVSDPPINDVPNVAGRAGRLLGFDAEGQPVPGSLLDDIVTKLDDLLDVDVTTLAPAERHTLVYNATKALFENKLPLLNLDELINVAVPAPAENQILKFVAGQWINGDLPTSLVFVGEFDPVTGVPALQNIVGGGGAGGHEAGATYLATDTGLYDFVAGSTAVTGNSEQVNENDQVAWSEKQTKWVVLQTGAGAADGISYDNSTTGLTATNVQDAIDEVEIRSFDGYVDVKDHGATGDGATDDLAAINAAIAQCNSETKKLYFSAPAVHYQISGDITLPRFTKGVIKANTAPPDIQGGIVIFQQKTQGAVDDLYCENFEVRGSHSSNFNSVRCSGLFRIDGFNNTWGAFWNNFIGCRAGKLQLDVETFAVNANTFIGFVASAAGDFTLELRDNGGGFECHANHFINCDFSHGSGITNTTVLNQTNFLDGSYMEDTGFVFGNWDFSRSVLDQTTSHKIGVNNYNTRNLSHFERTGGDYQPQSPNILLGGEWKDSSGGVPTGFSDNGGSTVVTDAAMPGGSGRKYGKATATTFQYLQVSVPIILTEGAQPRFTISGFWAGDLPALVDINNGGGASSYGTNQFYELKTGYYFFTMTGLASSTQATSVQFWINTSVGDSKSGYLGAVYVGAGKLSRMPYAKASNPMTQFGRGVMGYSAASPADLIVTFPKPYVSIPAITLGWEPSNTGQGDRMVRMYMHNVSTAGFTGRIGHTGDQGGFLHWTAIGQA